jgi:acyl-CoA hydrolase
MTVAESANDLEALLPPRRHQRPGSAVSIDAALDLIADGARVYVAPFGAVPTSLVTAMVEQRHRWTRIETVAEYLYQPLATFQHPGDPFAHCSLQPSSALEALRRLDVDASSLRMVPASTSQYAGHLAPGGPLAVDVALVQVSEPDPSGRFSLGIIGGPTAEVVRTAPVVIAEVNPAMPFTRGVTECDRSDFDALVEVEHPLIEAPPVESSDLAERVAANVVDLVPERATLEYGIGAIPDAVLAGLTDRTDLGVHSGMLGDGIIDLIDRGVVTGGAKTVDPGLHVVCAILGTERLYRWIDGRDDVAMVTAGYSHGVPVLARQERFCAINSAIEVALDGSVNAEMAASQVVAGPGGLPDFVIGADLAPGGVSILGLPSTAGRGRVSRIVAEICSARPVTVPRHLADRVVTEHGVAELKGIDLIQRAERLLAVAHPDHRSTIVTAPSRAY